MALRPPEEHVISKPDAYDLLNNLVVGNYNQSYYIEKEGLHIDYTLEVDEEEESQEKEYSYTG